jgi:hypothetical protein
MSGKSKGRMKARHARLARKGSMSGRPRVNAVRIPGSIVKFEIHPAQPCVGFAAQDSRPGEQIETIIQGSLTVDNGETLYERVDAIAGIYLQAALLKERISTDSLSGFVVVTKGEKATVYLNPDVAIRIAYKGDGPKSPGEVITMGDVADVELLTFPQIDIPDDAAIACYIRVHWRPIFYFDFSPNLPGVVRREVDHRRVLGTLYARTAYRGLFELEGSIAQTMFLDGWFPFIRLLPELFKRLQRAYKAQRSTNEAVAAILEYCTVERLTLWSNLWFARGISEDHRPIIESAMRNFGDGDYVAACLLLMPRIEGILAALSADEITFNQAKLSKQMEKIATERHPNSNLFLPGMFKQYLNMYYFRNFSPEDEPVEIPVSRHSVAHGWARAVDLDQKAAVQAFLMLDQLAFLM